MEMDSTPGAPTGIAAMMAQLDQAAATGKNINPGEKPGAPAPAAPAPAPTPAPAPKPPTPPVPPKPATPPPAPAAPAAPAAKQDAKPAQEQEVDWSKAPPKWYKIYTDHKTKTGETIKSLESKIAAIESKRVESPGDAKKLEALEKRLAEVTEELGGTKQKLTQRDYTQSEDYHRNFVQPANLVYKRALGIVENLQVEGKNGPRAGTKADLDRVRLAPVEMRDEIAKSIFGESAASVLRYTDQLDGLRDAAELAGQRHAEDQERTSLEREGKTKQELQQYSDMRKEALDGIKSNEEWGKWFREDENDPEASQLLRESYDEIEKITAQLSALPMEQQAAYGALYMARAAATPRLILENNRKDAIIAAMTEELEKYRASDPGAEGHQGVAPAAGEAGARPKGIDGAVAVFDQMPR